MNVHTPADYAARIRGFAAHSPEAAAAAQQVLIDFVNQMGQLIGAVEILEGRKTAEDLAIAMHYTLVGTFNDVARKLDVDAHDMFVALDEAKKHLVAPSSTAD